LIGLGGTSVTFAQAINVSELLNRANQMNNEEEDGAKELRSKAGDNQGWSLWQTL
jgi:hypothetical protein